MGADSTDSSSRWASRCQAESSCLFCTGAGASTSFNECWLWGGEASGLRRSGLEVWRCGMRAGLSPYTGSRGCASASVMPCHDKNMCKRVVESWLVKTRVGTDCGLQIWLLTSSSDRAVPASSVSTARSSCLPLPQASTTPPLIVDSLADTFVGDGRPIEPSHALFGLLIWVHVSKHLKLDACFLSLASLLEIVTVFSLEH